MLTMTATAVIFWFHLKNDFSSFFAYHYGYYHFFLLCLSFFSFFFGCISFSIYSFQYLQDSLHKFMQLFSDSQSKWGYTIFICRIIAFIFFVSVEFLFVFLVGSSLALQINNIPNLFYVDQCNQKTRKYQQNTHNIQTTENLLCLKSI